MAKNIDLSVDFCGIKFKNPFMLSSSPVSNSAEMIANAFTDEVVKQGSEMLELEVYEDTSPTLWTNFRVVATATIPETEGVANPLPWAIIIVAVLVILFVVAVTYLIKEIKTIDWTNPVQAIPTALLIGGVVVLAGVGIAMAVGKKAPEKSSARA